MLTDSAYAAIVIALESRIRIVEGATDLALSFLSAWIRMSKCIVLREKNDQAVSFSAYLWPTRSSPIGIKYAHSSPFQKFIWLYLIACDKITHFSRWVRCIPFLVEMRQCSKQHESTTRYRYPHHFFRFVPAVSIIKFA
jgi:hypothetical protein